MHHEQNLDGDWELKRQLAHKMIDDVFDFYSSIQNERVWNPLSEVNKAVLDQPLPQLPQDIGEIYEEFKEHIFPFYKGNIHPRFWAWVQGAGAPTCALADMLAAFMNPNTTIGEHAAMYVDEQVVKWSLEIMGFPATGHGLLTSGGSMANITALIVARNHALEVRENGLKNSPQQLTFYCSTETHSCVQKAIEIMGVGNNFLRKIPVSENYQIQIPLLQKAIETDLQNGYLPVAVIGNAATVNTAAIDDLNAIFDLCQQFGLWFHVDGAYGAPAKLVKEYEAQLGIISKAHSVAFDYHKWFSVPYEAGCVLVHDRAIMRSAFAISPAYLMQHDRGLVGGGESTNNYGMELSRSFKALKIWMHLKEHGIVKHAQIIEQNIHQIRYLETKIKAIPHFEILAPVSLNILCFRYNDGKSNEKKLESINREILLQLQEKGIATISPTILKGKYTLRVCNVNHRTTCRDFDLFIEAISDVKM